MISFFHGHSPHTHNITTSPTSFTMTNKLQQHIYDDDGKICDVGSFEFDGKIYTYEKTEPITQSIISVNLIFTVLYLYNP